VTKKLVILAPILNHGFAIVGTSLGRAEHGDNRFFGPANADFVRADIHLVHKSMEPRPSEGWIAVPKPVANRNRESSNLIGVKLAGADVQSLCEFIDRTADLTALKF
jgi:hypothetical protein